MRGSGFEILLPIIWFLVCAIIGFVGGGIYGEMHHMGWFPQAWVGLGIGIAVCVGVPLSAAACH